jgi:hypothetical protein
MTGITHTLLTASFVVGAVVGNLLFFQYLIRSAWRATVTGKVLLSLFFVFALGYNLTVVVLLWPDVFGGDGLVAWLRIGLRFLIDAVLIAMYVLLVRAQRRDREFTPPEGLRQPSTDEAR